MTIMCQCETCKHREIEDINNVEFFYDLPFCHDCFQRAVQKV